MAVLIETKDLCKSYGSGEGTTVALKDVNLDIREGELLAILGSSGSGKSTLLNILGGMDKADSGSVLYKGADICTYNDRKLTDYRKDCVGFVFQSFNLIGELTAWENVALTAADSQGATRTKSKDVKTEDAEDAATSAAPSAAPSVAPSVAPSDISNTQWALETVGLLHKRDKYPSQLSGGEQQRISIARALAKETSFLLCDEPTGALDYETGKQILVQLWDLARIHGKTIVVVTHTQEITRMCDRVIRMRSGQVVSIEENSAPVHAREIEW